MGLKIALNWIKNVYTNTNRIVKRKLDISEKFIYTVTKKFTSYHINFQSQQVVSRTCGNQCIIVTIEI